MGGRTEHDATRPIDVTVAFGEPPTRARGVRALSRARSAACSDPLATRRYDPAELARVLPSRAEVTRTRDLARSLELPPRTRAHAHASSATGPAELADALEPLPIAIGLRARGAAWLGDKRPALLACVVLLCGAAISTRLLYPPAQPPARTPRARTAAPVSDRAAGSADAGPPRTRLAETASTSVPAHDLDPIRGVAPALRGGAPMPAPTDAIESLVRARYAEALARYERLSQAEPAQPAYAAVVAILKRRLSAYCTQQGALGGEACSSAAP